MGDTNRNDEALGAIGTAFGKMLFAGSELAQRAAIETIETRAVSFLRARGIDPLPWLAKARVEARERVTEAHALDRLHKDARRGDADAVRAMGGRR